MARHKDLQPWLDYFGMLRTYEEKGYLAVQPDKHEAYITRAAWLTLAEPSSQEFVAGALFRYIQYRAAAAEGLKDYEAAMLVAPEGPASENPVWLTAGMQKRAHAITKKLGETFFAIHIVKEDEPHDLLSTVVLSRRRVWWKLWLGKADRIEVVPYAAVPQQP